jgi:hypothetical protein
MRYRQQHSLFSCAVWMVALGLALLFLPALNGLVAGFTGGYRARGAGRALGAALAPAALTGAAFWLVFGVLGAPMHAALDGLSVELWAWSSSMSLLAGAILGGSLAPSGYGEVVLRVR